MLMIATTTNSSMSVNAFFFLVPLSGTSAGKQSR